MDDLRRTWDSSSAISSDSAVLFAKATERKGWGRVKVSNMFEPPNGALLWPDSQSEPDLDGGLGPLELEDGLYYRLWPEGALRLLAFVSQGRVRQWVRASQSQDSGCCCSEDYPRSAQRYYQNGTQEDFSPWDDNSPPYPAERTFASWLRAQVDGLSRPPDRPAEAPVVVQSLDRSVLPIPGSDRAFSCAQLPAHLEELLDNIQDVRWTSALQCYERLVNWARWDLELARDFTNLAPHACASVFAGREEVRYQVPCWLEPGAIQWGNLEEIPLYLRLRELAQSKAPWVVSLAQLMPGRSCGDRGSRPSHCLIWTTPPESIDPFWMAMHSVSLRLRQDASFQGTLGSSLKKLDGERFFQLGGLVGALLQAPACTGCWFFDPTQPPWQKCHPYLSDLASLLNDWSEFDGPSDPYKNHWQKAPLLASLGQWVNLQCGGDAPDPVFWQLARFVQKDRDNLGGRLAAFSKGLMHWDVWCNEWPGVYNAEPSSMASHWGGLGLRVKKMAEEFAASPAIEQFLDQLDTTRFAFRVQTVAHRLTRSLHATNPRMQSRAEELEAHLREHSALSSEECLAVERAILGVPLRPGKVFLQGLQACRWSFLPWLKADLSAESSIFPALRIFLNLLAEF